MVCPACSAEHLEQISITSAIAIHACRECGLLVSEIQPPVDGIAEFARINDDAYHHAITALRIRQAREVIPFVKRHESLAEDWLDIGCSFGYLLSEAQRAGYRVFGIEPDAKALAHARRMLGEDQVRGGMMNDEARPDASADIVSMMDVLEHVPATQLPAFARMVHRKLRGNGLWLIKVPTTDGLYFTLAHRLRRLLGPLTSGVIKRLWQSEYEFPHTVYFNRHSLTTYVENHGFDVLDSRYVEDVPTGTVISRLRMDDTIPAWLAYLIAPGFLLVNLVERWRGKSDSLMLLARRR